MTRTLFEPLHVGYTPAMPTESPERRVRRVPLTLAAFIAAFLIIVAVALILLFAL